MRSLANLFSPPTPEKIAEKELQDMRLTLFQAERRLLEAQMQVDYYRNMISFLEEVGTSGVEGVADKRRAAAPATEPRADKRPEELPQVPQPARVSPGLTTVPIVPSAA
ncbi:MULTISPECIES: hypothetical protein [Cupriavidus]|jgi:hypothetical protein|uniref:Uncharacterized protein n=1 Tax=Cupriavidus pauculus TaxID=82633 RepID=A0A5P2HCP9_9BURK|nr:hypothetical protein [Cupriavidus pauculus]QET06037.1 hypothetical protein FOB72_29375 [Cupriavidus pauculus]